MKKKLAASLLAAGVVVALTACATSSEPTETSSTSAGAPAACESKTEVTMLGTIKIEIQDEFLAAVDDYNSSQDCYEVVSIPGNNDLTFLANVTPMYAANEAPTIMYTLQEIPDMADKVMDWTGTELASLAGEGLLAAANVGGKQVGVPSTAEAFGLLYNEDVLTAAGVDPAAIKTRSDLEAAFQAVEASGKGAIRFSALWWSLGAHFTNTYFANAAADHEGRLAVLDQMADGTKDLLADPVFENWLATFELLKKYNAVTPNLQDTEYSEAIASLGSGEVGFWFMGNWAEPDLIKEAEGTNFGIMPLPISDDAASYGNDSISVGVPGYFMIDEEQSTEEERAGAVDFLTWLYTSPEGQMHVAGNILDGNMSFIPVYSGFTVEPTTFMAQQIADYVNTGRTIEWINTYYPAGGQDLYGASGQKLITSKITGAQYAVELQDAWKGVEKTWR